MGIEKIEIENYKSIKKCTITLEQLNLIIGENGCGKTNVISAIKYFYDNMIGKFKDNEDIFDENNSFSNKVRIAITYDCKELKKIVVHKLKSKHFNKNKEYYKKINELINKDNQIYLELIKIKNMQIKWNINSYNSREIIYNNFPFYFIEARDINIKSWDLIWKEIGDFLKLEKTVENELQYELLERIKEKENLRVYDKLGQLENILNKSEIQIKKYTPKQYVTNIAKNYFHGENFKISGHNLKYFSDGTNAFNYLNVLIKIINAIKGNKIKFPVIIVDEPEISLHHKYIDVLSEEIIKNNNIQYILATHSSRLLKNILRSNESTNNIIHLSYENKYTKCSKMKLFDDKRQKVIINDEHANCYFSSMIFLVEGESELQLFYNKYLQEIFPILKKIDIVKAATDDVIKNGLLPEKRNYKVPYLILIDLDKIIESNKEKNTFVMKKHSGYFKQDRKEKYHYGTKRQTTYVLQKRIKAMLEKCRFHYILPFYSCTDINYYTLIRNIKEYLLQYNVFVNKNTIEGVLVNENNMDMFWEYFKLKKAPTEYIKQYYEKVYSNDQLNLLRLLVSGKTDYILNVKDIDDKDEQLKKEIKENVIAQKTNGWMSEWLGFYLCKILNIPNNDYAEKELMKRLTNEEEKEMCKNMLQHDFTELVNIIKEISKRYSN